MVYQDKDVETNKPILQEFKIRAFPTFVITDGEGKELFRSVGAPFSSAKDGIEWVGKVSEALGNISSLEAAHKEKPEDVDTTLKLSDAYKTLGKNDEALKLCEAVLQKLTKEDKRYVDVTLAYAGLLYSSSYRGNPGEIGPKVIKMYEEVLPGLLEAKDERAIDPKIQVVLMKLSTEKDYAKARTEFQNLAKLFPKSDRIPELKYYAAVLATRNGDTDTAIAELEAIVKEGPEDDVWVKRAESQCDRLKKARGTQKKK